MAALSSNFNGLWISDLLQGAWTIDLLLIFSFAVVLTIIERALYRKLHFNLLQSGRLWDDVLVDSLHYPLLILIWLLTFLFFLRIVFEHVQLSPKYLFLESWIELGLMFNLSWFFLRLTKRLEMRLLYFHRRNKDRKGLNPMTINAVSHLVRILVMLFLALSMLQLFGVPVAGVLAFGGVGGLVAAYGAKDQLSNFFSGLMIFWDRPFVVGDWIYSPDKAIEGTVEYIGWRLTMVKTFDQRVRYIPNSLFASIVLENASRMTHRRLNTTIGIRYDDAKAIPEIIEAFNKFIKQHEHIDHSQPNFVYFNQFSASSLDLIINLYTTKTDWLLFVAFKQEIFLAFLAIIDKHKAQCAFPTRTVHMINDP